MESIFTTHITIKWPTTLMYKESLGTNKKEDTYFTEIWEKNMKQKNPKIFNLNHS